MFSVVLSDYLENINVKINTALHSIETIDQNKMMMPTSQI